MRSGARIRRNDGIWVPLKPDGRVSVDAQINRMAEHEHRRAKLGWVAVKVIAVLGMVVLILMNILARERGFGWLSSEVNSFILGMVSMWLLCGKLRTKQN